MSDNRLPDLLPYATPGANRQGRRIGRRLRRRRRAAIGFTLATCAGVPLTLVVGCVAVAATGAGHGTYDLLPVAVTLAVVTLACAGVAASLLSDDLADGERRT